MSTDTNGSEVKRKGRDSVRFRAGSAAKVQPFRGVAEPVRLLDISTDGCGFESRWPLRAHMMVLLMLPGLEPWPATIIWYEDGRGGMQFTRKLHPAVVARYAKVPVDGSLAVAVPSSAPAAA